MKTTKMRTTFLALVLAAITALTAFATPPVETKALSSLGRQTAALNSMLISYGNQPAQVVQTYLVNNQNFVRVREVITPWNMDIQAFPNELYAVYIYPMAAATVTGDMEAITLTTATVDVKKGAVYYDGYKYDAEVFLLNNRYYFKLQDIAEATYFSARKNVSHSNLMNSQSTGIKKGAEYKEFPVLDVAYDAPTNTVIMTRYKTDVVTPDKAPTRPSQATPAPDATATAAPSPIPSKGPVPSPTASITPSAAPSVKPSASPSAKPSAAPSVKPSATPTPSPSAKPSAAPTPSPSATPTPTPTPSPSPSAKPSAMPTPNPASLIEQVLQLTNKERANAGLPPYTLSSELSVMAQAHSEDMAQNGYFSHTSPTYGGLGERLRHFNIRWATAGENIHVGSSTAEGAVASWMASTAGHREAILSNEYTEIGIGYAVSSSGSAYWTQVFRSK